MKAVERPSKDSSGSAAPVLSDAAEKILAKYEQHWQSGANPEIETFLPDQESTDYLPLLEEMIRVDLEFQRRQRVPATLEEYQRRFPALRRQSQMNSRIEAELKRLQTPTVVPQDRGQILPPLDSEFHGFQLLSPLGQGAFARVYLAKQNDLAQRLVVLKVAQAIEWEAQSLARLQHTNIVPIFSVHESRGCQAICMPFLGVTTLADLVDLQLDRQGQHPSSAQQWISTVAARKVETIVSRQAIASAANNKSGSGPGTIAEILRSHLSFQFAALQTQTNWQYSLGWIWSQVAEGLSHAHGHGITHGDIKPANILLTDDGHPLLLDFNLASNRHQKGAPIAGGTLPYMSAEQLMAFQQGVASDEAGDLYSLAVVMYQLFTGRLPFAVHQGDWETTIQPMLDDRRHTVRAARRLLPDLHPDLDSILTRSLHTDPQQRYRRAEDLLTDLQAFLQYRPLKIAPNQSWWTRVQNWGRRHPRLSSATSVAAAATLLLFGSSWAAYQSWQRLDRIERVEQTQTWEQQLRQAQWPLTVIDPPPTTQPAHVSRLRELLQQTPDTLVGGSSVTEPWITSARRQAVGAHLTLAGSLLQQLQTATLSGDMAAMMAEVESLHRQCAQWLPTGTQSVGLLFQQSRLARVRGNLDQADRLLEAAKHAAPQSEIDRIRAAYEQLSLGDIEGAIDNLRQAVRANALDFEAWLLLGNAQAVAKDSASAESSYTVCLSLEPDSEIAYYNRGRSRYDRGDLEGAEADFSAAISLNDLEPAYYSNRALIAIARENWPAALADLTAAIDRHAPESRLYFLRAQVLDALDRTTEADADRALFLEKPAVDTESLVTRSVVQWQSGNQDLAIKDLDQAIQQEPQSLEAWQNRAAFLAELPDQAAALAAMDRVVALQPSSPVALATRGVLHARCGQRQAAERDAEAALNLDLSADTSYRVAGIFAQLSRGADGKTTDRERAWQLLHDALRTQPQLVAGYFHRDPDLDPLKSDPKWAELLETLTRLELLPSASGS